eukprot:TRINITY_DN19260_c0_g1_i1.p1 TRINITY_DN19260_c0_g1~~TRINITY_DN19260_c0_g1_i1.p1  ORF type:complete len:445 (-),score=22.09 TRINITY_DN19260_c0_g1_i1:81-1415(-)
MTTFTCLRCNLPCRKSDIGRVGEDLHNAFQTLVKSALGISCLQDLLNKGPPKQQCSCMWRKGRFTAAWQKLQKKFRSQLRASEAGTGPFYIQLAKLCEKSGFPQKGVDIVAFDDVKLQVGGPITLELFTDTLLACNKNQHGTRDKGVTRKRKEVKPQEKNKLNKKTCNRKTETSPPPSPSWRSTDRQTPVDHPTQQETCSCALQSTVDSSEEDDGVNGCVHDREGKQRLGCMGVSSTGSVHDQVHCTEIPEEQQSSLVASCIPQSQPTVNMNVPVAAQHLLVQLSNLRKIDAHGAVSCPASLVTDLCNFLTPFSGAVPEMLTGGCRPTTARQQDAQDHFMEVDNNPTDVQTDTLPDHHETLHQCVADTSLSLVRKTDSTSLMVDPAPWADEDEGVVQATVVVAQHPAEMRVCGSSHHQPRNMPPAEPVDFSSWLLPLQCNSNVP